MKPSFKPTLVSGRSVAAGLICVALICFTEAHNDYYVNNTWLAAHHFPIVAAFLLMILVLGAVFIQYIANKLRPAQDSKERLQPWEDPDLWDEENEGGPY